MQTMPAMSSNSWSVSGRGVDPESATVKFVVTEISTVQIFNPCAAALVGAALLGGCAAPARPLIDPTLPPERIVQSLSNHKLSSRGTSNDGFGLDSFKSYLRPVELRCQRDGGNLAVVAVTEVHFGFRDPSGAFRESRVSMPQRIACRSASGSIWGISASYANPTFFPSAWTGDVYYYATVPLIYEAGASLDRSDPNSPMSRAARIKEATDCEPWRQQYTKQVRSNPTVGMKVKFGVIVEVRPPMVLIQYDEFGRQMKMRDQEWVQASTLGPGANCPE